MANTSSVWGLNEKGEIVAVAGTGTTNIVGFLNEDMLPTDAQGRILIAGLGAGGGGGGTNGKTVLSGTVAPASNVGTDGDFYINTATSVIYGPKAGGAWPTGVSLVGPQGLQGIQGIQGVQGIQGLTGPLNTNAIVTTTNTAGNINGLVAPNGDVISGRQYVVTNGANFATRFSAAALKAHQAGGGVVYVPYDPAPYKVEKEILLDSLANVALVFDPGVVLRLPDPVTFPCTFNGTAIVAAAQADVANITSWDFYNRFYVGSTALPHGNFIVANVGSPDNLHFTVAHSTNPTAYPLTLTGSANMTFYPAWNILRRKNCTNVGIVCQGGWVTFDGNSTNQATISITSDEQDSLRNCLRTEGGTGHYVDGLLTKNAYFHGEIGVPITGTEGTDVFTITNAGNTNGVLTSITTTIGTYTATVSPMQTGITSGMLVSGIGAIPANTLCTGATHNSGNNTTTITLSKPAIATTTLTDGGVGKTSVVDRIYIGRYKAMNHGFRGVHYHGDRFTIVRDFTAISIELENNGVISRTNVPSQYRVNSGMFVGYENCHRYHIGTVTAKNETGYGVVFAGRNLQDVQAKNFYVGSVIAKDCAYAVALYNGMRNVNIGSIFASSSAGPINVGGCTLVSLGAGTENKSTAPSSLIQTANGLNVAMTTPAIIGTIQLPSTFDMSLVRVGSLVQIGNLQVDDSSGAGGKELIFYSYNNGTLQYVSKRLYVIAVDATAKTIQVYQDSGPANYLWGGVDAGATRDIVIYNGYAGLYLGGDYTKPNQLTENIQIGQMNVEGIMAGLVMSKASFVVTANLSGTGMTVTDSRLAVGQTVSGAGIPDGTVISDVNTSGTLWTLSNTVTTANGVSVTVGPYNVRTLKIGSAILDGIPRGFAFYNIDDVYLGSVSSKNTCDNYHPSNGVSRNDSVSVTMDFSYARNIYGGSLSLLSKMQTGLVTRSNGAEIQFSKQVVDAKFNKTVLQNGNSSNSALTFSPSGYCGYIVFNDVRTSSNVRLTPAMPNATCIIQRPAQSNYGQSVQNGDSTTPKVAFTIAHGLSGIPASINVTAGHANAVGPYFVTADATNITVTYTTAPVTGTGNVILNWNVSL